jgi:hypothetical protein
MAGTGEVPSGLEAADVSVKEQSTTTVGPYLTHLAAPVVAQQAVPFLT